MPKVDIVSPDYEKELLHEAIQSPAAAMMRISLDIDMQLRLLLAAVGLLRKYSGRFPTEAVDLISRSVAGSSMPAELRDIVKTFWDLRNAVIHEGGFLRSHSAVRAMDYGFRILRLLQSIPRPSYIVEAKVPVWADRECTQLRQGVSGVILHSFGPKGEDFGRHIYPSRKDYAEGQSVSWEWGLGGPSWGETWYREPDTGESKLAWSQALEFIGRPLDQIGLLSGLGVRYANGRKYNIFIDQMDDGPNPSYMIALMPSEIQAGAMGTHWYNSREEFIHDLKQYLNYTDDAVERFFATEDRHQTLTHFVLSGEVAAYFGWLPDYNKRYGI